MATSGVTISSITCLKRSVIHHTSPLHKYQQLYVIMSGTNPRDSILAVCTRCAFCHCRQIGELSSRLLEALKPLTVADKRTLLEWAATVASMSESAKLATRIHLLTLMFEVRATGVRAL